MKMSVGQFIGLILIIVIAIVAIALGTMKFKPGSKGTRQAVFLTNGQVYFGNLTDASGKWVTLKDIYYLQVQQQLQQGQQQNNQQQPQISLVKLGNELHGPVDVMKINRDQVLFYEDMKNDSKVNQAIADFIKNGPAATPAPQSTTK